MTLSTIFSASNQHRLALAAALLLAISSTSQAAETDSALLHKLKLATNEVSGFDNQYDAQVWLVAKDRPLARIIKDPAQRLAMLKLIHSEARRADLQPEIVLALIEVESAF